MKAAWTPSAGKGPANALMRPHVRATLHVVGSTGDCSEAGDDLNEVPAVYK